MKRLVLLFILFIPTVSNASPIIYGTVYAPNGTVTSANLNGNFTNVSQVVNGGLDNTNANTTQGYRFYQTVAVLPSPGNMGAVYFLTSDDTLNFDTGSSFIKTVGVNVNPAQGDVIYYGSSGWTDLTAGTSGQSLITGGASANPSWGFPSGLNISSQSQGDIIYYNGANWIRLPAGLATQVLVTAGPSANPQWASVPTVFHNYGTSTSSFTNLTDTSFLKISQGTTTSIGSTGTFTITNLPFTSSTSYIMVTTQVDGGTTGVGVVTQTSGSQATITNTTNPAGANASHTFNWIAIGV